MIQVDNRDRRGYRSELGQADTLTLEKSYCHFSTQGHKDFLNAITAYEPEAHGVAFKVSTFRGNRASVRIAFPEETVFRFTMLPEGVAACGNAIFSFPGKAQAQVLEDESFIYAKTAHLKLRFRKLPWEMTVILDGKKLTGEQIKDFNVDQRYKSLPCGFALDDDGRVLHTYETMYMHCDESFYGFGERFTDFNKRGQKITVWQRDAASTNPALVDYMTQRVGTLMRMGVGVIKTDFSEEIPEDAVFYDGTTGAQSHNRYPLLYAKTIYEASRAVKETMGQKALLWGRSGYLGSQNYPANWAGDSSASLNNLASILAGGLSIGISGVSFWGFDIGGFYNCDYEGKRTVPEDEKYIRSAQMGLMSPLSRSHGQATPREPWIFSETAQAAFLKINKLRYRLLPYLYSTAYETHNRGIPMMRALLLEFPQDRNVRTIGTDYMLGEAVLVAPVFDQQEHAVYLPKGSWIDLEREARLDGGWIVKEKRIDAIPLFLRENRGLFRLAEAPMHIADENFREITFVIQCAIAAAENERVPIIIQFYPGLDKYIPLNIISYIAKDLVRKASVPVAVHLDHSAGYEIAMSGIRDGFPSVMVEGSSLPFEENVSLTAQVVKAASVFGVDIEAELGHVGIGQNLEDMNSDLFTNVDQAVEFTQRTGCGSPAIAVGNAHGDYTREPNLDFERIKEIRKAVSVPLVLHGCSGIPDEQMRETVNLGMSKFNIATEYFAATYSAFDGAIQSIDHNRNGRAMLFGARKTMVDFVTEKIRLLNPNKFSL